MKIVCVSDHFMEPKFYEDCLKNFPVFPSEPLKEDDPFIKLDNVTLTNHRGGDTVNCYSDSPEYLITALCELLNNGKTPKFYID